MSQARWQQSREISTRLIITGNLILTSPAHLGNGDRGSSVDLPLLLDTVEGRPLLQGSSLAGALRNYLRAYEQGLRQAEKRGHLAELLFGGVKGDPQGDQSPLIIDDALGERTTPEIRDGVRHDALGEPTTPGSRDPCGHGDRERVRDDALVELTTPEIRDGVRIDGRTRTALPNFKYDLELLPPGTCFPLRFELLLPANPDQATALRDALTLVLQGLQRGEIFLGARKSRGYGRCTVEEWKMVSYDLHQCQELLAWLSSDYPCWGFRAKELSPTTLDAPVSRADQRKIFRIEATLNLATAMLIRSEEPLGGGDQQPDVIQLRNGLGQPVVSGTSLAGVLRARAVRVLQTLGVEKHQEFLDDLFGYDMHGRSGQPSASRLIVDEARIDQGATLVQNRVSIDRFTGGALDTALFSEAPQVGGEVKLTLSIHNPKDADKGLLLLLLKDLWTRDLAIGGTSSIGRGRLEGCQATICDGAQTWTLKTQDNRLVRPDLETRTILEGYVAALRSAEGVGSGT